MDRGAGWRGGNEPSSPPDGSLVWFGRVRVRQAWWQWEVEVDAVMGTHTFPCRSISVPIEHEQTGTTLRMAG